VGLMIAFAINFLVVAPVKAWRFMRPLVVNITGDDRSPDYTFNETIRGYNSTVIVRNRSHVHLVDCTAHVVGQISPLGFKEDRFIEKFTLPPQSRKAIYVTRWFSRESPHTDDKVIFLNGPIGGLNGNINDVASEGAELRIKIHAPGVETIFIRCRV
jgi:transcription antitermination factor NusG